MDYAAIVKGLGRSFTAPRLLSLALVLLFSSLYLMSTATQGSESFSQLYILLLVINVLSLLILLGLIIHNLARLLSQYRRYEPGSRMTLRLVNLFVLLSIAPAAIVFYFSIAYLHRGIDSWFDVKVEKALEDGLELSRNALDVRTKQLLELSQQLVLELQGVPESSMAINLNTLRERAEATELTVFKSHGHIIASSVSDTSQFVPTLIDDSALSLISQDKPFLRLDNSDEAKLFIRIVVPFHATEPLGEPPLLQALFPLPSRMSELANNVEQAFTHYKELAFLRQPLKYTFTLSLSLVLLLSMLSAVWAGFYYSRRLVAPVRDLAEGTRAVASGEYNKRLPVPPNGDELAFLVHSFNDMTHRIGEARDAAQQSRQVAEEQHTHLQTILARLSSGVMTVDNAGVLKTANAASASILKIPIEDFLEKDLAQLKQAHPHLAHFCDAILERHQASNSEWREELTLFGHEGRQVLMCRGTPLSVGQRQIEGQIIVFDDITALMQAQRNAAWAEVARRLAHEIKNPLTPIQLSAERLRHKYLDTMAPEDADVLDRATHTIVQQVETLKAMVKAFSEYARTPQLNLTPIDLNRHINEVLDLYHGDRLIQIHTQFDERAPVVEADPGRMRQLFINLIKNAFEARREELGLEISIETECLQEAACRFVEIRLCDNGGGIPDELSGQIFEPYVTTKPKGSGLGLAIVKKIVEEHGGMIRAVNQQQGACFVIRLPVINSPAQEHHLDHKPKTEHVA